MRHDGDRDMAVARISEGKRKRNRRQRKVRLRTEGQERGKRKIEEREGWEDRNEEKGERILG